MKRLVIGIAASAVVVLGVPVTAHAQTLGGNGPEYYLALGDSLAAGIQPNAQGVIEPTDQGYPNQLNVLLQAFAPGLQLANLGCSGETTGTFTAGGICDYQGDQLIAQTGDAGSQLSAALAFLSAHPGQVPLITIDLGAANLDPCLALGSLSAIEACVPGALGTAAKEMPSILQQIHAADPSAIIAGMNYYDGYLGDWLNGTTGQATAKVTITLTQDLNAAITPAFQNAGIPYADVYDAYNTGDMTDQVTLPAPIGTVPLDVAETCALTWECAPPPQGPNKHPNAAGYLVMATAILKVLNGYQGW
jgi:lysophospholipase L1-like esterase